MRFHQPLLAGRSQHPVLRFQLDPQVEFAEGQLLGVDEELLQPVCLFSSELLFLLVLLLELAVEALLHRVELRHQRRDLQGGLGSLRQRCLSLAVGHFINLFFSIQLLSLVGVRKLLYLCSRAPIHGIFFSALL